MEEQSLGWLKKTAIGCGLLIVLAIVFFIVMAMMVMTPLNRALDARRSLEERFGPQEAYVPPASGVPSPDRIEAFLEVRRSLTRVCADLANAEQQVEKLESFDDQEEVDRVEVLKQAFSTTRSMMGVGPAMGHLYETRNASLVEADMGLGEFTYIFVVVYRERLLEPPTDHQLFGPGPINRRVRAALLTMMENQLAAARSDGGGETETAALAAEIEAMRTDSDRVPWQDGLPHSITDALRPYRAELDELYCPPMAALELMIMEKRGAAIESI